MKRHHLPLVIMVTSLLLFASKAFGQMAPEFKYAPQAKLLPSELGRVYLGIRLSDIAKQIDLSKAYVENDRSRFHSQKRTSPD